MPVRVQQEDFDIGRETAALTRGNHAIGAVASFIGLVRDVNEGDSVSEMTLEHYPGMTERAIERIAAEAEAQLATPLYTELPKDLHKSLIDRYLSAEKMKPADLAKARSFGIRGLHERAGTVGGWVDLTSSGRGTTLILSVPIEAGPSPGLDMSESGHGVASPDNTQLWGPE